MNSQSQIHPMNVAPIPRLSLREPEAAEALGVSSSWLRREAKAGRLPSVLIAGVRLYPVQYLHQWLTEQTQNKTADRSNDQRFQLTKDFNDDSIKQSSDREAQN